MAEPQRRAEYFIDPVRDHRFDYCATAGERASLTDVLGVQRATLELKCTGVDLELSRRSVEPSTLSLLGLIRHLADVERHWFRTVMAGQHAPPRFSSPSHPDGDFATRACSGCPTATIR
jgi:hypothetical protein